MTIIFFDKMLNQLDICKNNFPIFLLKYFNELIYGITWYLIFVLFLTPYNAISMNYFVIVIFVLYTT